MARFCLALARICSAVWIGAALLFVITSVTEQIEPAFDAVTRDRLALIRFPWYYGTGALLLLVAFFAALVAGRQRVLIRFAAVALFLAACVMATDYALVFQPLKSRLSPPGAQRTPEFRQLHAWSERLNSAGFLLSMAAVALLHASRDVPNTKSESPHI
jgi:hypothetical protein